MIESNHTEFGLVIKQIEKDNSEMIKNRTKIHSLSQFIMPITLTMELRFIVVKIYAI